MKKAGNQLAIGDVLTGGNGGPSGTIVDFRPQSIAWPQSVAVRIGEDWHVLAADGHYAVAV